jgi:hypothetical protein
MTESEQTFEYPQPVSMKRLSASLPRTLISDSDENMAMLDSSNEHELSKRRFNAWAGKRRQLSKRRFNAWAGR